MLLERFLEAFKLGDASDISRDCFKRDTIKKFANKFPKGQFSVSLPHVKSVRVVTDRQDGDPPT